MTSVAGQSYGMQRVQELLGISKTTITQLVNAGFVAPSRGPRNEPLFSFQDSCCCGPRTRCRRAGCRRRRSSDRSSA